MAALALIIFANCGGGGSRQRLTLPPASPGQGAPGTQVQITGGLFTGAEAVLFSGLAADFTVVGDTEIRAEVPPGAVTGPVTVTVAGSTLRTPSFRVLGAAPAPPAVAAAEPLAGPPGTEVFISGSGFTRVTAVTFAGVPAEFEVLDDSELRAAAPPGLAPGPITLTGPAGQAHTEPFSPAAGPAPDPQLEDVLPARGRPGSTVTLLGTGFTGATAVRFNGTAAAFKVVSFWRVDTTVPADAASGPVTVTTPAGTSEPVPFFEVDGGAGNAALPAPVLLDCTPAAGPAGTTLTLLGSGLQRVQGVYFGVLPATFQYLGDTQITAQVPPGAVSGPIALTAPGGQEVVFAFFNVTPVAAQAPTIDSAGPTPAQPRRPAAGASGLIPGPWAAQTPITIMGSGYTGTRQVTFNGIPAPFAVVSDSRLDTWVPPGAGSGAITITSAAGQVSSLQIQVAAGPAAGPTITGAEPGSGAPDTLVLLSGSGLQGATAVTFGGVAARFTVLSPLRLEAFVPQGAVTGALTVTTPDGAVTAPAPFTVLAPPPPVPAVQSLQPTQGPAGTLVALAGTDLKAVTGVAFGAKAAPWFSNQAGLTVVVPAGAASGPLTLTYAAGSLDTQPFTVTLPAPTLAALAPRLGPVGCPVTLTGQHFDQVTGVQFGGVAVPLLTVASSTEIQVQVPAGAKSGPVTVTTAGGSAVSAAPFRVTLAGQSNLDLRIAGLNLNQGVQRLDGSIALVRGRPGLLRVFVTANVANTARPVVRVKLWDQAGTLKLTEDLAAPAGAVPTSLDDLNPAWSLALPPELIQPGLSIQAQLDPDNPVPDLDPGNAFYPGPNQAQGFQVLEVPPLQVTLVPVESNGLVGNADQNGRKAGDWPVLFTRLFPTTRVDMTVAPPWHTDEEMADATLQSWTRALAALSVRRLADPNARNAYWVGVVQAPRPRDLAGLAYGGQGRAGGVALVLDHEMPGNKGDFRSVFAHEMGHALGRGHSPCGDASGVEAAYPHPGAFTGATGVDLSTGGLKSGKTHYDLMAYCDPRWISDFTYQATLSTLTSPAFLSPPQGLQDTLIVWGAIQDGQAELKPAFQTTAVPEAPAPGPYTLEGLDAAGQVLLAVPFSPRATGEEAPGPEQGPFAFSLPMAKGLATLRVLREGQVLTSASARPPILSRPPVATRLRPGTVYLSWDRGSHPMALVKDPRTGTPLALSAQGGLELPTGAEQLEVLLSDGVATVRRLIPVE